MNADLRGFLGLLSVQICVNPRAIFIYVPVDVHIVGRNRLFQHPVRKIAAHWLWMPESLPILLPNLQRAKHIDRKTSGYLSLGLVAHYLFVQNERHGF